MIFAFHQLGTKANWPALNHLLTFHQANQTKQETDALRSYSGFFSFPCLGKTGHLHPTLQTPILLPFAKCRCQQIRVESVQVNQVIKGR